MEKKYSNAKIKDLMNQMVITNDIYTKPCVVTAVNEDELTCDVNPSDGTPDYFDVLLAPTSNSTNVQIPNVGSTVFVHFLDHKTPYVTAMDSVNKTVVRSTNESAEHDTSLKEALEKFADDIQSFLDVITYNTPSGPTTPGVLEPGATAVSDAVTEFKDKLNILFKD